MLFGFISLLLFLCTYMVVSNDNPQFHECRYYPFGNYTSNSTFAVNLEKALATIQKDTASTGFNATTAGEQTEQPVTALALCRGTLSPSNCQTCIDAASLTIRQTCPNQKAAQIWYDLCMIRYSSTNFIGKPDYTIGMAAADDSYAPDPDSYVQRVESLMQNLSSIAVSNAKRYAVGKNGLLRNLTVYGYVDCTRDVSGKDCAKCFSIAMQRISTCCSLKWFGWILTPTCNSQFNMNPVHDDWEAISNNDKVVAPLPPLVTTTTTSGGGGGGGWNDLAVKVSVVVVVTVIMVVGVMWVVVIKVRTRRKSQRGRKNAEEIMKKEGIHMGPFLYDFNLLVVATDNFSPTNRLGRGGFGTVYKGKMASGEELAVKKLASGSIHGMGEFFTEVKLLLNIQHRHLVRLFGCCIHGEERMLVYEYLPNKSLDYTLFDKSRSSLLDWEKRYNIILGVARGLQYLHEDSLLKIIHRDIKASNILLDQHLNPKISDFGLATLFNDQQSHIRTLQIAGTFGYMAPEYANQGFLSAKSDVFSFGVLILEIVSGRKNFSLQFDEEQRELLNLTWRLEQEGKLLKVVDETMGSFPQEMVLRCIKIGLLCCQESIEDRPTMSSALAMLTSSTSSSGTILPPPGRPGYHTSRYCQVESTKISVAFESSEKKRFSVNSVTTSLLNGR